MTAADLRGASLPIYEHQNDALDLTLTFLDAAGSALDLSGYTLSANVYTAKGAVAQAITLASPTANSRRLTLTATQMGVLARQRNLTWSLQADTGSNPQTWIAGPFSVSRPGHGSDYQAGSTFNVTVNDTSVTVTVNLILDGSAAAIRAQLNLLEQSGTGTFTDSADAATAFGYANTGSTIVAGAVGSIAGGATSTGGDIITGGGRGNFAFGYARTNGQVIADGYYGAFAHGYAYGAGATVRAGNFNGATAWGGTLSGTIEAIQSGATAFGYAFGVIRANNWGSLAHGYTRFTGTILASGKGASAFGYGHAGGTITASSKGGVAFGYADATIGSGSRIQAGGTSGSFAQGSVQSGGVVETTDSGATAFGYAYGGGLIRASASGALAHGLAWTTGADVTAGGIGSFAHGWAYGAGASIATSANGARAGGHSYNGTISASGQGSFAHGRADYGETISAAANNAVQFGVGTNAQADSLQVGSTMRLKGTTGAPTASLHNGDIWVANNYVYIRSNGASVKIV